MSEEMPSNSEREAPGKIFRDLEETLERLRARATPPPPPPESWLKKTLSPAAPSTHQTEFNLALVDALTQMLNTLRHAAASQEARLALIADELLELRPLPETLDAFREHMVRVEAELRSAGSNVRGLQERSAALETELAALETKLAQAREQQEEKVRQLAREQNEKIQQLAGEQPDLRREVQERIQHLLDEQRVCIRQLSLQASEEAVLANRARRALELKLEELARRLPPPPA